MENIVISIGGSVILSDDADASFFKNLVDLLQKTSKTYKVYLVVGGGKIAREYIHRGRALHLDEKTLDELGIAVTRVNAILLSSVLGIANKTIPPSTDEATVLDYPIVVMGGTIPGHSTDYVGAELAVKTHASRFIIATNVDGIYDKDPNKHKDAKQFPSVSINELVQMYGTDWKQAGSNMVIDGPALQIIQQNKITTFVVNGKQLTQLEKAIKNQPFHGTKIIV